MSNSTPKRAKVSNGTQRLVLGTGSKIKKQHIALLINRLQFFG